MSSAEPVENAIPPRSYTSPEAFRQALEQRVRSSAGGAGMARFRQVLVFDRFLARMFAHFGERAILKGGVVLELHVAGRSRTLESSAPMGEDSDTCQGRVAVAVSSASNRRSRPLPTR